MDGTVFMEKIVAKKRTFADTLFLFGMIFATLVVSIAVFLFLAPIISSLWIFADAAIIYGAYALIRSRSIEFEYVVTGSDLDIDRIIAQRRRKRIFSANCTSFEIVAKVKSAHYDEETRNLKDFIDASSSPDAPDAYFIKLNYKNKRTVVVFEPDERMIKAFKLVIPRKVFVD